MDPSEITQLIEAGFEDAVVKVASDDNTHFEATVICAAYLCIPTGWPSISAQTTVSCAKFFGVPPPIISSPVVLAAIFISVSSRKSRTESIVMCCSGLLV